MENCNACLFENELETIERDILKQVDILISAKWIAPMTMAYLDSLNEQRHILHQKLNSFDMKE